MSFIAPWYLLGLLAIGVPILLHLRRRHPTGEQPFSSLLFVTATPPTTTTKRRVEHWLLLLLRIGCVMLLAIAFARPFLPRHILPTMATEPERQTILLVDTSASMSRPEVNAALKQTWRQLASRHTDDDNLLVLTFDDAVRSILDQATWSATPPDRRATLLADRLDSLTPTEHATDLGHAVRVALDHRSDTALCDLIILSDFQSGADHSALTDLDWPTSVTLHPHRLGDASPANVGIALVGEPEANSLHVRLTPSERLPVDHVTLTADGLRSRSVPLSSSVARTTRLPRPHGSEITLTGDDVPFDNTVHIASPQPVWRSVLVITSDDVTDPDRLAWYLPKAFPNGVRRKTVVTTQSPTAPLLLPVASGPDLVIVTTTPDDAMTKTLREYLHRGGQLLFASEAATDYAWLSQLFEHSDHIESPIENVSRSAGAMLTDADLTHSLFQPFATPELADFTRIPVWQHRRLPNELVDGSKVLMRFDGELPAIVEHELGDGRVLIFATTWSPNDSRLAIASKFVPLLNGLLDRHRTDSDSGTLIVGDVLPSCEPHQHWRHGDTTIRLAAATVGESSPAVADSAGLYHLIDTHTDEVLRTVAVNLSPAESRTAPLTDDELHALGLPIASPSKVTRRDVDQTPSATDAERHRPLWRALLWTLLGLIVGETLVARLRVRIRDRSEPA